MAEKGTLTRFDGSAVWSSLPPKAQAELGSVLLDFLAARRLEESFDPDSPNGATLSRIISAHDPETIAEVMGDLFAEAVPIALLEDADGDIAVPISYGAICRVCGCSDHDACHHPACRWVDADLCSACGGSDGGARG